MFYLTVSKLIPYNACRIFLIGTICYILLHAYLYSKNVSETFVKYRHWLYYIFIFDLVITGSFLLLFGKSKDADNISANSTNNNDENNDTKPNINEIKEKLLKLQSLRKQNQDKKSTFAKKVKNSTRKEDNEENNDDTTKKSSIKPLKKPVTNNKPVVSTPSPINRKNVSQMNRQIMNNINLKNQNQIKPTKINQNTQKAQINRVNQNNPAPKLPNQNSEKKSEDENNQRKQPDNISNNLTNQPNTKLTKNQNEFIVNNENNNINNQNHELINNNYDDHDEPQENIDDTEIPPYKFQ